MCREIRIELCGGVLPVKAHVDDAAYDVFVSEDFAISSNGRYAVPLGFRMQLPRGLAAIIQPRSGMSLKGLTVMPVCGAAGRSEFRVSGDVCIGLVDSGYTGEVKALVVTGDIGANDVYIPKGTKIAQMRILEVPCTHLVEGAVCRATERGDCGFNSTGTFL